MAQDERPITKEMPNAVDIARMILLMGPVLGLQKGAAKGWFALFTVSKVLGLLTRQTPYRYF